MVKNYVTIASLLVLSFWLVACSSMPFGSNGPSSVGESSNGGKEQPISVETPAPPASPGPVPTPEPIREQITKATFAAVGDVLIHRSLYHDAQTADGYDFYPMFDLVEPFLINTDLAMANPESMIGGEDIGLSDYPRFNSPYEIGTTLKDIGIDAVTMANNHTLDRGEKAVLNAIAHWDSIGMIYTGAYKSEEDSNQLRVVERNDISFALLGYTYGTNGIPIPEGKEYLVNLIDVERMIADIEQACNKADVIVVQLHFGNEYERMPSTGQREMVEQLSAAGADLIIGHHPHVLQPFEWIEREDGRRTFVAYSLGNFISGQEGVYREIAGIVHLDVKKRSLGEEVTIELSNPSFLPTWTHKRNWRDYRIIPLEQVTEQQLPGAAKYYEEIAGHIRQWMPELELIAASSIGDGSN